MPPDSEPSPQRRGLAVWALVAVLAAGVVAGAASIAFLCDDAFITFRHVANARAGHGLVWNAPPFHPVEGYTGFAWALLLWGVWAAFGVEPPAAANVLSITFGVATFVLVAVAALALRRRDGRPVPAAVAVTALAVLGGNRTFLQWLTGGLETALFNFAFVAWTLLAFRSPARRGTGWLTAWSGAAALAALTRPDGLLLVAATAACAVLDALRRRGELARTLLGLLPLATVAMHVAWRRWCYGEWLPNTYFAKVTAPWPEAGWRYLYCFAFEHGVWWWALLAAAWLAVAVRRGTLAPRVLFATALPALAAVAANVVHVGYYTLRIGGDHFEYRVLSQLVPLLVLSAAAMTASLSVRPWLPLGALAGLGLAGGVGWLHHALVDQKQPPIYVSLAAQLPPWARPLVRAYDRHQAWLHLQFVCMRCSTHASSLATNAAQFDDHRAVRDGIARPGAWSRWRTAADSGDLPVVRHPVIGLLGWKLADVYVLDELGLCDRVIARSPAEQHSLASLPAERMRDVLGGADADADGAVTRAEFETAIAKGFSRGGAADAAGAAIVADVLVVVFATGPGDTLVAPDVEALLAFLGDVRFMAHERRAPPGYIEQFDPNVTLVDRRVAVRPREVPLTPERVRAIEAEWWRRVHAR